MNKWWKSDEFWFDEKVMNSRFQLRHPPLFASPKVMKKWWKSDEIWSDEKVMKNWWNLVWWKSDEFEVSAETSSTFRIPKGDEQVMKKWWILVWWKSDEKVMKSGLMKKWWIRGFSQPETLLEMVFDNISSQKPFWKRFLITFPARNPFAKSIHNGSAYPRGRRG